MLVVGVKSTKSTYFDPYTMPAIVNSAFAKIIFSKTLKSENNIVLHMEMHVFHISSIILSLTHRHIHILVR